MEIPPVAPSFAQWIGCLAIACGVVVLHVFVSEWAKKKAGKEFRRKDDELIRAILSVLEGLQDHLAKNAESMERQNAYLKRHDRQFELINGQTVMLATKVNHFDENLKNGLAGVKSDTDRIRELVGACKQRRDGE